LKGVISLVGGLSGLVTAAPPGILLNNQFWFRPKYVFVRWSHEAAAAGSGTGRLPFAAACFEGSTTVPIIPSESLEKVEIW